MDEPTKKNSKMTGLIVVMVLVVLIGVGGLLIYMNKNNSSSKIAVGDNQKAVSVNKNQEFIIKLVSNPSTGYTWSLSEGYDKTVVGLIGNVFVPANTDRSGAPGEDQWTFRGISTGKTKISLVYARSWESTTPAQTVKDYSITVK
jgi:predicted secreted protein